MIMSSNVLKTLRKACESVAIRTYLSQGVWNLLYTLGKFRYPHLRRWGVWRPSPREILPFTVVLGLRSGGWPPPERLVFSKPSNPIRRVISPRDGSMP